MKAICALLITSTLALTGCSGTDPDDAVQEADPGVEATIEAPAEETASEVSP